MSKLILWSHSWKFNSLALNDALWHPIYILVNIGSGNGLVPCGTKPLSKPMLSWDSVYSSHWKCDFRNCIFKTALIWCWISCDRYNRYEFQWVNIFPSGSRTCILYALGEHPVSLVLCWATRGGREKTEENGTKDEAATATAVMDEQQFRNLMKSFQSLNIFFVIDIYLMRTVPNWLIGKINLLMLSCDIIPLVLSSLYFMDFFILVAWCKTVLSLVHYQQWRYMSCTKPSI